VYPDGHQETPADIPDTPATQAYYAFFGGQYRKPSDGIGPIWFQQSAFDCQRDFLRSVCGV
jgi:hypothetical protein